MHIEFRWGNSLGKYHMEDQEGNLLHGNSSQSCPMVCFGISGVKSLGYTTSKL